jgi:heme/copper-type cytochrome/quinol oxidase subunit 2
MLKLGRWLLLVVACASGFGALVVALRWPEARRAGDGGNAEAILAILVAMLAVALLALRVLAKMREQRNREELASVRHQHAFEASGSPGMPILFVLMLLLFGFGIYHGITKDKPGMAILGAGLVLLFLFLGSELVRQALRPGPMLRMDASGIEHALYGPIPWTEVVGLQLHEMQVRYSTQYTLLLGVREPLRYLRNAPPLTRWLQARRLRDNPAYGALPIGLNVLGKDPKLVYDAALALRRANGAPLLQHWHQRMDAREVSTWLRSQETAEEMRRLTAEMEALPANPSPEQVAALDAKMREHMERQRALHPEVMAAIRNSTQRAKTDARSAMILGGVGVAMFLLWLWAKFA